MKKRFFDIWLVSVVLIALIVLLVPSCEGGGGGQCTIEVKATLDGAPYSGAVKYWLGGPDAIDSGPRVGVPQTFTDNPGEYSIDLLYMGEELELAGAQLINITPSKTQDLPAGGTITFTLNFRMPEATTIKLEAKKDAEVREYYPDLNLGGATEMWVAPWGPHPDSRKHRAFVWFSLASLPAGAQVQSATLYLYHIGCYGTGNHTNGTYRITDVWEEMIITWNNQPPSAGPTDDINFDICDCPKWRSWDVTPDIDAIAIETGWVSWVIKHIDEEERLQATVVYQTKEGDPDPYLEITYLP